MLSSTEFDLWAGEYDRDTAASDEAGTYPFAGYRAILNEIGRRVLACRAQTVLDLGFGTAVLTSALYDRGLEVFGQDFSPKMLEAAQAKMPQAHLYPGDFARGVVPPLQARAYDAILATYALHHLTDAEKVPFLLRLRGLLSPGGTILLGDVAFRTREELERCRAAAGDDWDDEEFYFVADELRVFFPKLTFEPFSPCAGIITIPCEENE